MLYSSNACAWVRVPLTSPRYLNDSMNSGSLLRMYQVWLEVEAASWPVRLSAIVAAANSAAVMGRSPRAS